MKKVSIVEEVILVDVLEFSNVSGNVSGNAV